MRLQRLDLTRYGKFTDYRIDFGDYRAGAPDLHVVYGPNEAGKSTLFAAWLDVLFGIHPQSPYNFLHPYSSMRIGAALQIGDVTQELARVKKNQNSLLDGNGRPVPELVLRSELGGMDREAYRTLFSLDDASLEQGGESILKARGELGQLLFSASSGLADLSAKIEDLRGETDHFHRPRAQSGELQSLKDELDRLKQERARIDTQASRHAELTDALKAARLRHEEATTRRALMQARRDEIQRLLGARPWLGKLRGLRERLASLEGLPDAPPGWTQELPALRDEEITLETQLRERAQELERLQAALAAIPSDPLAEELARQLSAAEPLRVRYLTAEKDLPARRARLTELDQSIAFHLRQIEREGEAQPERLILPASTVERIRELMEAHSGVVTAADKAAEERDQAQQRASEAAEKLGRLPHAPGDPHRAHLLDQVRAALEALRASDHGARRRLAEVARRETLAKLADGLSQLQPWRGDAEQLFQLAVPEAGTLQQWSSQQQSLQRRQEQQRAEIERLQTQCAHLAAQHDAVAQVTGLATDQQAAAVRFERDRAWDRHLRKLDAASADEFEEMLRRDDGVVARRFEHLAELAQLRAAASALTVAQSDLAQAQEAHARAVAEGESFAQEIHDALRALSPQMPPSWSLPHLTGWLERREKALAARAALQAAHRGIEQAQDDAGALAQRLLTALSALNGPMPAATEEADLVTAAQTALEGEERHRRMELDLEERQRDVAMRELALTRAEGRRREWEASWNELCASCWLGERGTGLSIATVRGILGALLTLSGDLNERRTLADRIDKMERDMDLFQEAVLQLAGAAGLLSGGDADERGVLDRVRQIEERVRKAEADRDRKTQEEDRIEAARASARQLATQKAAHDRLRQQMLTHLRADTLAEGATQLAQIGERVRLRQEVADMEQQILTTLRGATLAEVESTLDGIDQPSLEKEISGIEAQWEPLEQEWRDSYSSSRETQHQIEAIGGDDAVARLEEQRRTLLLAINDGAQRYLRLRAGTLAMEHALRLYREQHRSSMMAGASKAMRVISRGAFTHLTTQPDANGEILVGVMADRSSKLATEMSKGTRFQLYLALRVAGYLELARSRTPVPFMADDIMETFDDFRAEEAFRLFSAMARVGQVIYLTHHRHLCDIAREVCPGVTIHELPFGTLPRLEGQEPAEPAVEEGAAGLAEVR